MYASIAWVPKRVLMSNSLTVAGRKGVREHGKLSAGSRPPQHSRQHSPRCPESSRRHPAIPWRCPLSQLRCLVAINLQIVRHLLRQVVCCVRQSERNRHHVTPTTAADNFIPCPDTCSGKSPWSSRRSVPVPADWTHPPYLRQCVVE